jgi:hypothetical protein
MWTWGVSSPDTEEPSHPDYYGPARFWPEKVRRDHDGHYVKWLDFLSDDYLGHRRTPEDFIDMIVSAMDKIADDYRAYKTMEAIYKHWVDESPEEILLRRIHAGRGVPSQ